MYKIVQHSTTNNSDPVIAHCESFKSAKLVAEALQRAEAISLNLHYWVMDEKNELIYAAEKRDR